MPQIDRQLWANRLYIVLCALTGAALVALMIKAAVVLPDQFRGGVGAGILLANACLMGGSPLLRPILRRARPAFGAVPWDARGALNSGLSLDDYEKSVTTEKMLRTRKQVDRFSLGVGAFTAAVAAFVAWTDVDEHGSAAWAGLLVGLGLMSAMLAIEALLLLAISWIRRWALGPALVGRAGMQP